MQLDYHDLCRLESYIPNVASLPVRQFNDAMNFATSVDPAFPYSTMLET
jgi:hypothetical protein